MKYKNKSNTQNGFALLLALIISSVVLAIGVSLLDVSINQLALSSTARESEVAFQASHAGIDCMEYWRSVDTDSFTSTDPAEPDPYINCFGTDPISRFKNRIFTDPSSGNIDIYTNIFQWGDPNRCTGIVMYIMTATTGDIDWSSPYEAVGNNGDKICLKDNTCTIIVSDGYNRACNDLGSTFAVQRELTVEF